MNTNLAAINRLTSIVPSLERQLDDGLRSVHNLAKKTSKNSKTGETAEELKVISKIIDTVSTFITEMVKTFEKMRSAEDAKGSPTKVTATDPAAAPTDAPPLEVSTGAGNEAAPLGELAPRLDEVFTKLASIQKKVENLSKKVSALGKKLLKGASGGASSIVKKGVKLLSL